MKVRSYARIQDGAVAELLTTEKPITTLFHAALIWVDVTEHPAVSEGWLYDGSSFAAPVPPATTVTPSLAQLQAQLMALSAQIAALGPTGPDTSPSDAR